MSKGINMAALLNYTTWREEQYTVKKNYTVWKSRLTKICQDFYRRITNCIQWNNDKSIKDEMTAPNGLFNQVIIKNQKESRETLKSVRNV